MCIQENGHKTAVFALCDKATIAIDPTITGAVLCRGLQILGGIGFGHRGYFTKVGAQKGAIGIIPKDKIAGGKGVSGVKPPSGRVPGLSKPPGVTVAPCPGYC